MYPINTQDGWFHDGDGVSELGTVVTAEWLNQIQAEIINVLDAGGIEPKKDNTQLVKAILQLINSNKAGSASSADRLTTPRAIGGVQFNGTGDVHLPISNFSKNEKYEAGDLVKIDGVYYECYHPDGCKGKDPRDPLNRPAGWQNTDPSQPYYWLKIGKWLSFPEVGSPIYLPTAFIREGLIKYRNDGQLHKNKFWRLAELYPDLINKNVINIADLRAEFIRGLDDGRGIDAGRQIGSWQIGTPISHDDPFSAEVFDVVSMDFSAHLFGDQWIGQLPTAYYSAPNNYQVLADSKNFFTMTRPRNVAMLIATRI